MRERAVGRAGARVFFLLLFSVIIYYQIITEYFTNLMLILNEIFRGHLDGYRGGPDDLGFVNALIGDVATLTKQSIDLTRGLL